MAKHGRIELLGQLRLRVGDSDVTRFRTYKTGALLAYLAYFLSRATPREELIEMLWPESSPDQARNSLSQSLSSLRHLLEPPGTAAGAVLEAGRHTVRLLEQSIETDVRQFREIAKLADQSAVRGELSEWDARASQAVSHFNGEFLPGYYEDWTINIREQLREEVLGLLDKLARARQSTGNLDAALVYALQAVTIDSTREASHQIAIQLYDALGQPDSAVKQFRELEKALWTQLGLKPSDTTIALVKTSMRRERNLEKEFPAVPTVAISGTPTWLLFETQHDVEINPTEGALTRPGLARLTDPEAGLRIAEEMVARDPSSRLVILTAKQPGHLSVTLANSGQILCDEATAALLPGHWIDLGLFEEGRLFATKETAGPTQAIKNNRFDLPHGLTKFFGRQQELEKLANLLVDSGSRVVTLTGPGGMGKTRLSVEAARQSAERFPRGVAFVGLENTATPDLIWSAIAQGLKLAAAPNMALEKQILAVLEGGRWLLVFDNFEQLCDVGGQAVVEGIITQLPELTILVSSRRRLGISGEVEVALDSLPWTDQHQDLVAMLEVPSVALFMDRAKLSRPDFQLTEANSKFVADLCERLEGVPLALELAAARIQVLSPKQILERFEQRLDLLSSKSKVERHRSLRHAIDWTYSILPNSLQTAFRRLAVFQGGWFEIAADGVLASPVTLDILSELREVSLITSKETADGTVRFQMLETLREYGLQASDSNELVETKQRHADAILSLLEDAEPRLEGVEQVETLNRLEADRSNIKAAIEWSIGQGHTDSALRCCSAAWRYWHLKSHLDEGRHLCVQALKLNGGDPFNRARVLNGCGRLAYLQGDYDEAQKLHESALALGSADPHILAMSKNALGAVAYERGQYANAVDLFEECLTIRKGLGDDFGVGNALSWLGIVLTDQSRYDEARAALQESLAVREAIGDVSGVARSLNSLGIVARRLGEFETAVGLYEKALVIQRQMGDRRSISGLLSNLGMVVQALGDKVRAKELFVEAWQTNLELGDKWGTATALANLAAVLLDLDELSNAATFNAEALKIRFDMGNQWGVAFSLEGCAHVLIELSHTEVAVLALASADKIRMSIGSPLPPADQHRVSKTTEKCKITLGSDFESCWSRGQTLQTIEIVETVLRTLAP